MLTSTQVLRTIFHGKSLAEEIKIENIFSRINPNQLFSLPKAIQFHGQNWSLFRMFSFL